MRVAVVAVGDELLLGAVVNSNLARLGQALAAAGLDVVRGYEVGDDVDAMVEVLRTALAGADAVVVSGGLGPTSDDRTREALAILAGASLDEVARELPNPVGSAPGVGLEIGGVVVLAVPGVPRELEAMIDSAVLPELRGRAAMPAPVVTRQLHAALLGESRVAQRLAPLEADLPAGVRLSYLAGGGDVRVRFTGTDVVLLEATRERAAALLGDVVSGYDDETLAGSVLRLLGARGWTLAVAESLTGGAVASALVEVAGASSVFVGAVVAYATPLKTELLGVPADLLARTGAVHEDVGRAMAVGVRGRLGADWGVATTGVAGPDAQDGVTPGTVVVAVAGPGVDDGVAVRLALSGDRAAVRGMAVVQALDLLRRTAEQGS